MDRQERIDNVDGWDFIDGRNMPPKGVRCEVFFCDDSEPCWNVCEVIYMSPRGCVLRFFDGDGELVYDFDKRKIKENIRFRPLASEANRSPFANKKHHDHKESEGVKWEPGVDLPSSSELRKVFDYDPATGVISKKGQLDPYGYSVPKKNKIYTKIYFKGKQYYAHRVAWAMIYGSWPKGEIDHINGDSEDNSIANLRVVDRKGNCQNQRLQASSKSGHCGVNWHDIAQKWRARVKIDGKEHYVGLFDDIDEAAKAITEKRKELGFHENHGKPAKTGDPQ